VTKDAQLVGGIISDYTRAVISSAEHALLDFAVKLTVEPWAIEEADIARLRAAGWSDRAILDLTLVVAYFAFVNRLAQGLGIQVEQGRDERR
jgi:uncharacterized peroxidase-related enzyme